MRWGNAGRTRRVAVNVFAIVVLAVFTACESGEDETATPLTATATPAPSSAATETPCASGCVSSGIKGNVVQGPVCPVETDPPQPECAPRPYAATIQVWDAGRTTMLTEFTADEQGRFKVQLEPGDYSVEPQGEGLFPQPPRPFSVTVLANEFVQLEIEYDTGIR